MGGYSTMTQSPEEFPQEIGQQMRRRGLLPALMGVAATPAGTDRVQDDPVTRNNPEATGAMSSGQAPVGTSPTQRDTLADEMMQEYKRLGQPTPAPQPVSLKQQILQSVMRMAPIAAARFAGGPYAGLGAAQGELGAIQNQQRMTLAQQQMAQQHEQQRNSLRERMLQEIMQQQRTQQMMQSQEERESGRNERLAQQIAAGQEKQQTAIGQQNEMEQQKEAARSAQAKETEANREASQARQFAQQESMANQRFAQQERMANQRFGEQEKLATMRQQNEKATADEQRRADLATNLNENLNQLEDIVKRRPDLFGPLAGRMSTLRSAIGTNDADLAKLKVLKEQTGLAMVGTHSMRNAQHAEKAANAIFNSQLNGQQANLAAIQEARNSLKTFQQDVLNKGGMVGGVQGGRGGGQAAQPIVQHSRSTGQYRYSLDGGKTWQQGQPPSR